MPNGAMLNCTSFSSAWCGAWSLAMQSTAPSARPLSSASRSFCERRGGFILVCVEKPLFATSSSVRIRWWGATSQVTPILWALARRTMSRLRAVERWATW